MNSPLPEGFSLIEMLVSVSIIIILMAMLFQFIAANQKQYSSQQLQSIVSQGPRSAFEIMTQEFNQAGYNPPFTQNRTLATAANASGSAIVNVQLAGGGTTPITRGIFYGTRLVIGNACVVSPSPPPPTVCDQEEVTVTDDPSYTPVTGGTRAIQANTVPVVLTNNHASGEAVFSRNYPYPTGVYYDNRTAGVGLAVADNKIKFYGDIMGTGDLYYGEYRLQHYDPATNTFTPACSDAASSVSPFVLTRFMTKLADPTTGIFTIPASKATALDGAKPSPLVDNIQGVCQSAWPGGFTWPWVAPDETSTTTGVTTINVTQGVNYSGGTASNVDVLLNPDGIPAIWFKFNTFGAMDTTTSPAVAYFQSFVMDLHVTLTVQQSLSAAQGAAVRTQRLQTHIVPKNILDAMLLANGGASGFLPLTPYDPATGNRLPLP